MWRHALGISGCAALGLLIGLLLPGVVRQHEPPAVEPTPPPSSTAAEPRESGSAKPATPPLPDPTLAGLETETEALLEAELQRLAQELDAPAWLERYTTETEILVDGRATGARWVLRGTVRVPCERVDAFLAQRREPSWGEPDRCRRWREAARQVLANDPATQPGIAPDELIHPLEEDRTVRVLELYVGWRAPPRARAGSQLQRRLVAVTPLYPQAGFVRRRNEAQNSVLRALELGPYAIARR
ncbi:MAG: hypothetical protein ACE5FG_09145 [Myxococcota bacterium]